VIVACVLAFGAVVCLCWGLLSLFTPDASPGKVFGGSGSSAKGGGLVRTQRQAALAGAVVGLVAAISSGHWHPLPMVGLPVALAGVMHWLPSLVMQHRLKRRRALCEARILDLTVGLAASLRAGVGLVSALQVMASNLGGPMGDELRALLAEYGAGIDLPEAFEHLYARVPSEDLRLLATAIKVTTTAGGSLAQVLDRIGETIRARTEFRERLATMTAQGMFEAVAIAAMPLIAFFTLLAIDSSLMMPLITTPPGWLAIGVAVCLEVVGFFTIKQVLTVEV